MRCMNPQCTNPMCPKNFPLSKEDASVELALLWELHDKKKITAAQLSDTAREILRKAELGEKP